MSSLGQAFDLLCSRIVEQLTLVDIGARWGALDAWKRFENKARIICFEADEEEASRLNTEQASPNIEYAPYALAADDKGRDLVITEGIGCSSTLQPLKALYERYPGCAIMRPVRTVSCPSISLDTYCESRSIEAIHGMKLDTQGSELDILTGARRMLSTCLFLNIEVEFNALYDGQGLFCDLDRFMRDAGFTLWRFGNLAHYSTGIIGDEPNYLLIAVDPGSYEHVPTENGQVFWADAFYVRSDAVPTSEKSISLDDAINGAALVSQYEILGSIT